MTTFGRRFQITIAAADNLPKISVPGKMKAYAEAWIDGRPTTTKKSGVESVRETNPRWDFVADYTVLETDVQHPGVNLVVKISCESSPGNDRSIGEVKIPLKGLFDMGLMSEGLVRYKVEGTSNGVLYISYSFGQKIAVSGPPPAAGHDLSLRHVQGQSWGPLLPGPAPTPAPVSGRGWGPRPSGISRFQEVIGAVQSTMQLADGANRMFFHGDLFNNHHRHDVGQGQSSHHHHVYNQDSSYPDWSYNDGQDSDWLDSSDQYDYPDASDSWW